MALDLNIPHLSCYALTVEPSTALYKMIAQKKIADVVPEQQARQFLQLMNWLEAAGYEQYEISNFARPGFRSRHNSSYWRGVSYLGLGPSAHSYNGTGRQWNVANNTLYIQALQRNEPPLEAEMLTKEQQWNEYIMIALRTTEGIDLKRLEKEFGPAEVEQLKQQVENYIRNGRMEWKENRLRLTKEGKLFADGMAGSLFK